MKTSLLLLLTAVMSLSGCSSYLTKSGRQQAAYERYVHRSIKNRDKLRKQIVAARKLPPPPPLSEPVTTTSLGPESISAGESQ